MLSLIWAFAGVIVGLLIVAVFEPPKRQVPAVPTPGDNGLYHTKAGCVKIQASEVECAGNSVSLNTLVK
jgi:hypothetical protein